MSYRHRSALSFYVWARCSEEFNPEDEWVHVLFCRIIYQNYTYVLIPNLESDQISDPIVPCQNLTIFILKSKDFGNIFTKKNNTLYAKLLSKIPILYAMSKALKIFLSKTHAV